MTETISTEAVAREVAAALEAGQLGLPVLPDTAIRIRDALGNPEASLEKAIHVVSCDPVLAVHVIKAANSSAFYGAAEVNTLRGAVSRVGFRMLYGMAMNLALTKIFRAKKKPVDQRLRATWRHSREVATNCFVLAEREALHPDVALLAGLVHEIGALPLCLYADRLSTEFEPSTLATLIENHAVRLSLVVLEHWDFPRDIVGIVAGYGNPACISDPSIADYVDILELAVRLEAGHDADSWRNSSTAERFGFYPGDCQKFLSSHAGEIGEMHGLLGIGDTPRKQ
jgi:HD-like signal output (HDOD) protein